MENRSVIAHGGGSGKHGRQRLVFHFDQSRRLLRDVNIDRRDARHGMALVADLVTGENIVPDIFQRSVTIAYINDLATRSRQVRRDDDCLHSPQSLGFAGVNRFDAGVGVRATQDGAMQ